MSIFSPFEQSWITNTVLELPSLPQLMHSMKMEDSDDTIKGLVLRLSKVSASEDL